MSESSPDQDQLERYLDGLMDDQEAADFVANMSAEELNAVLAMEAKLDASLQRISKLSPLSEDRIARMFIEKHSSETESKFKSTKAGPSRKQWIQLAIAASLFIAIGIGLWTRPFGGTIEPFFQPRPLAMIYTETVERGFRPNYNCEEPERFANTFQQNHGQSLALGALPEGRRMLGLSTLGGISRSTVAMLCTVDNQNVIVFVDRVGNGDLETAKQPGNSKLNVFVESKNGLVFVEVTPLDSAKMIQHFQFLD